MKESIFYSIFLYVFIKEFFEFNNDVYECYFFLFDIESGDYQYFKMKLIFLERYVDFEILLYVLYSLIKGILLIEFYFC